MILTRDLSRYTVTSIKIKGEKLLDRPIAILRGGNAGHCMAADLTSGGFKINFYEHPNFKTSFQTTLQTRMVAIIDVGQAKIHKVTMDMARGDWRSRERDCRALKAMP